MKRQSGVTLVELLAVLAISSIILITVFWDWIKSENSWRCLRESGGIECY
ncbi:prepilin-type N-terminal cleavage/methylation domain-containing protein [Neobacillus sp. OS1-32]|nr:prepilin-type N-terminal cleavage/methylation domain-containing protein [Neobacillus sp. OS1-32]WML28993.1 prepilin-type N-terminal cleavage/methylation domain-containing protein [Neobacillus sp. OS1-32]